ncbi:MAG TPA: nucleotidyltransferase domain-containing protein [Sedimentisphaerales bacterium]|nr:nucleotidyltransferase domain-containing protein [Sedimentisphaerales bacterium]
MQQGFWDILKRQHQEQKVYRMVAMDRIKELGRQIGQEFDAERVILFGSYARGAVTRDSDVDLLVIGPFEGRSVDRSVQIRMKLRPGFALDLVVRTPEKVRERLAMGDDFMQDILDEGKVLYEADDR